MTQAQEVIALALAAATLLGLVVGWLKVIRPRWRAFRRRIWRPLKAGFMSIAGYDAILHPVTGEEISPGQPPLGQRMATVETLLVTMAARDKRLDDLEVTVARHDDDIAALKAGAVERVVSRAESTAAWRAMEAATKADPDQET